MKKKSQAALASIILALLIIVILGAFIVKVAINAKSDSAMETCKLSIFAIEKQNSLGLGIEQISKKIIPTSFNCPRTNLGDLDLTRKDIADNKIINQDKAHEQIAKTLVSCWQMVGEGDTKNAFETGQCLICKGIKFDEALTELTQETTQKIDNPNQYLYNNEYKEGIRYNEYMNLQIPEQPITKDTKIIVKLDDDEEVSLLITSNLKEKCELLLN